MFARAIAIFVLGSTLSLVSSRSDATEKLTVMISGGFAMAYKDVLPNFEQSTGSAVITLSGSSQGTGPRTIKSQLESGVDVDVVILSEEGLNELIKAGRTESGTQVPLASTPLGAAIHQGSPKPDISTVEALRKTLLNARLVVMAGSTAGLFIKNEVFPKLEIADKVSLKLVDRGSDATAMTAAGDAELVLGPISELVNQAGVELVGPLPEDVQLVQFFTAAILRTSRRLEEGKRLIDFLSSDRASSAIKKAGMKQANERPMR